MKLQKVITRLNNLTISHIAKNTPWNNTEINHFNVISLLLKVYVTSKDIKKNILA